MNRSRPIGIFDSGVGGLTVVNSLLSRLPNENFIYFGDTAHLPYGDKTEEQLFRYAHQIIDFLQQRRVKAILVACGTHSSVTLPQIYQDYSLPLLGVVKAGARSAVSSTRNGKIGVIATLATVKSLSYTREIKAINSSYEVFEVACPRFVPLIEAGQLSSPAAREAVAEHLEPFLSTGIDTLVLGCTHYPFLAPVIQEFVGKDIVLVDPACETVDELKKILSGEGLLNQGEISPSREFFVSADSKSFFNVGRNLIGDVISAVTKVNLD